jgi:hypothetical protein
MPIAKKPALRSSAMEIQEMPGSLLNAIVNGAFREPGEITACLMFFAAQIRAKYAAL